MPRIFGLVLFFGAISSYATNLRYESGLIKAVTYQKITLQDEEAALRDFLKKEYEGLDKFHWRLSQRTDDRSHVHLTFGLEYLEFPVFEEQLKVHFNKEGFIDYATSTLEKIDVIPEVPERNSWEEKKGGVLNSFVGSRDFQGMSRGTFGLWWNENKKQFEWVFDVEVKRRGMTPQRGFVSALTDQVLEIKKVFRHWDGQVFLPFPESNLNPSTNSQTISTYPTAANQLKNETAWVRYNQARGESYLEVSNNTSGVTLLAEYESSQSTYRKDCDTNHSVCKSQKVDSGNVYYHTSEFRNWVDDLDPSSHLSFQYDPLPMVVNFMGFSIQQYSDGSSVDPAVQANNAAYINSACADDGSMEHCLVFLQPNYQACTTGGTQEEWYSVAREAIVVAHEYQHYLTDMIAGIRFGSADTVTVGDVLHEGYSDYFASSYVTQKKGTDTNTIGAYAFQNCSNVQRDLSSKKVFNDTEIYSSPHRPGWVWASGLWELRTRLGTGGADKADAIALRSLYYLSSSPGFIDSVEALVQADKALYQGVNETLIRTLFFDERKFLGSLSGVFQDTDKKIVKVGFQGCSSIHKKSDQSAVISFVLLLVWVGVTLGLGRISGVKS